MRHDPRKWALRALESSGGGLPTSSILSKASALRGSKIPYYSIYQALRTLVRRRQVSAQRKGRELIYRLASKGPGASAPSSAGRRLRGRAAKPRIPAPSAPAMTPGPAPASAMPAGMHKIAPGEIALLHVGETHVEAAANIGGKLVLKRHPRPT